MKQHVQVRVAGGDLKVRVAKRSVSIARPQYLCDIKPCPVNLELRSDIQINAQPTDEEGVRYALMRIQEMQKLYGRETNLDIAIENFRLTPGGRNYHAVLDAVLKTYELKETAPDIDRAVIVLDVPGIRTHISYTYGVPMPRWAVLAAQTSPGGFKKNTVGSVIHYYFPHIPADNWHPYAAALSGDWRPLKLPDLPLGIDREQQLFSLVPALQSFEAF